MHQGHQRQTDQGNLIVGNLARVRRYKCNSGKYGLEKNIYLCFRTEKTGNNPLCSFQESEVVPYTSWVKEGHVLIEQGTDMTKVNVSICKFKEESNTQSCPTTQKESP